MAQPYAIQWTLRTPDGQEIDIDPASVRIPGRDRDREVPDLSFGPMSFEFSILTDCGRRRRVAERLAGLNRAGRRRETALMRREGPLPLN